MFASSDEWMHAARARCQGTLRCVAAAYAAHGSDVEVWKYMQSRSQKSCTQWKGSGAPPSGATALDVRAGLLWRMLGVDGMLRARVPYLCSSWPVGSLGSRCELPAS